jgi:hypothetical protein
MSEITYSRLVPADLERIGEIDRTERIDTQCVASADTGAPGEQVDQ